MRSNRKTTDHGFTLIELLIVIAIILILIAIALPNFLDAQIRAKVVKAKGEQRSVATAMESYFIDRGTYMDDCLDDHIGCLQLTTPVAYIKVLPVNSFGIGLTENNVPQHLRGQFIPYYPIGTGINPKTELKCCRPSYPPGSRRVKPPFREAYIIYSTGPSDLEPGGNTGNFPVAVLQPWTLYSATNGTKSYGGIITTGGVTLELPALAHLRATHL